MERFSEVSVAILVFAQTHLSEFQTFFFLHGPSVTLSPSFIKNLLINSSNIFTNRKNNGKTQPATDPIISLQGFEL